MSIQSLTPPQDITWTRLLFSRDMMDTNFDNLNFPPKWRSSMAVYFYIVPEEESVDAYPNSRIVYLKLSCSITGYNPYESLRSARKIAEESGTWDDLQRTLWEVIQSSGWASQYWPCLGAIMQVAVYPNNKDGVAPDDYPYIMDFEPKKRELFESFSEGAEILSGTSDKTSISKGNTSVNSTEYGVEAGGGFGGFSASASYKNTKTDTTVNQNTTDTSREARETLSRTTSGSQMYQLFNGYHLGTNRALFVVAPRPHTVSSQELTDFNLINGERKLEGIQDVFLVVHMPKTMDGFCVQASLDTGHDAMVMPYSMITARQRQDNPGDPGDNPPNPPDPPPPPPNTPVKQLIITRRIGQSCGTFDVNGNFVIRKLQEPLRSILGEIAIHDLPTRAMARMAPGAASKATRVEAANQMNSMQARINKAMLNKISAGNYTNKKFEETETFKSLAAASIIKNDLQLSAFETKKVITKEILQQLEKRKIKTVGELFSKGNEDTDAELEHARESIISHLFTKKA